MTMSALLIILLYRVIGVYVWVLIARMAISWIPLIAPNYRASGIVATIFEIICILTDPPLTFARRFIPPLNLSGVSLDLGFMVVFIAIIVLQRLLLILL